MTEKIKNEKKAFGMELKLLVKQKCEEINHYVSGCNSPFSYLQIADVQEHLCGIDDALGIKGDGMTEQIKNCNTCANATEDFNNDIDNGCYMCSKGIEDNYKTNKLGKYTLEFCRISFFKNERRGEVNAKF